MKMPMEQRPGRGFTIIELMVVVSMIALLLGFSVPLVFKIDELSRDRSGVNTFSVAVTAARAFATRRIADLDGVALAEYSGAAVMVTPMNQLRIIADLQDEPMEKKGLSGFGYDLQTSRMEPISMPRGSGVLGLGRNGSGAGGVVLLAPPFVIRFNRHGQLVTETRTASSETADVRRNVVYVDANFNGTFEETSVRSGYDPNPWDPDISNISSKWNAGKSDWTLPFEALESVGSVIVYSKADFDDSGGRLGTSQAPALGCTGGCGTGAAGILKWMFENGTVLHFSRNTGNVMRTKLQ